MIGIETFPGHGRLMLRNARTPSALLADGVPPGAHVDRDGAALIDILIDGQKIAAVSQVGFEHAGRSVDVDGRHVWPLLIDAHTHLDKAHIIGRAPDSGGTHPGARDATTADRVAHWRRDDLRHRMNFAMACADAHGVGAIRTHLDSHDGQAETTWAAFNDIRAEWAGRVPLQAVALVPVDAYRGPYGRRLADLIAHYGGVVGGVTRATGGGHGKALDDLDALLDSLFTLAKERDLDIDLHVDEAMHANALSHVVDATLRHGWEGRVTCGHCCSLALLPADEAARLITRIAQAGISIITLPPVNMYLQDRADGITPRWRGVTPVKELQSGGVRVAIAGDNCRDPFYAYGDHDMLDTWRQAVRILHLDHPYAAAAALAGSQPAGIMRLDGGLIGIGRTADVMILNAWTFDQVIARPQTDRTVVRRGMMSAAALPSYQALRIQTNEINRV